MSDTIYRQAAIDALCKRCDLVADDDEPCTEKCNDIKILEMLPSAMNDDLISRQAAIDRINKQREHLKPDIYPQDKIGDAAYRICAEFIERLPSAQPEIIRCKDCKYRDADDFCTGRGCPNVLVPDDGFCDKGETKR